MSAHPLCIDAGSPCEGALCACQCSPAPFDATCAGWPGPRRVTARPLSIRPHLCQHPSMLPHPGPRQHTPAHQCGAARVGALLRVNKAPPRIETPARWHRVRCADASTVSTWRRLWPHTNTATLVRSMGAHQPHDKTGTIVRHGFFEFPKFVIGRCKGCVLTTVWDI